MSRGSKELYEFGKFRLDVTEHFLAQIAGERVPLSEKAFKTLCVLVRNGGHLLNKGELLNYIWADSFVEENNVDKCIFAIRRALGEKPGEQKYIETVRKHGYRFVAEVRLIEDDDEVLYAKSAVVSEPNRNTAPKSPRIVEQIETHASVSKIAHSNGRQRSQDGKNESAESSFPSSPPEEPFRQTAGLKWASPKQNDEDAVYKRKNDQSRQITKRRRGLRRGLKFFLYGLGFGFVFLILMQILQIFRVMLLHQKNGLLLGVSNELAAMIVDLLTMLAIAIGLGVFVGIGLFLFGIGRMIYALFEKEDSKTNSASI